MDKVKRTGTHSSKELPLLPHIKILIISLFHQVREKASRQERGIEGVETLIAAGGDVKLPLWGRRDQNIRVCYTDAEATL